MSCSVGEGISQSCTVLAMANLMRSRGGSPLSVGCVSPAPRHDVRACESEVAGSSEAGEEVDSIVSRRRSGAFVRRRGFVDHGISEALEGALLELAVCDSHSD